MLKKIKPESLPLKKKKKAPSETRKGEAAKDNALCIAMGREISGLGKITESRYEKTRSNMLCIRFLPSVIT